MEGSKKRFTETLRPVIVLVVNLNPLMHFKSPMLCKSYSSEKTTKMSTHLCIHIKHVIKAFVIKHFF